MPTTTNPPTIKEGTPSERGTRRTDATVGPRTYPRTGNHDQNNKPVVQETRSSPGEKSRLALLVIGVAVLFSADVHIRLPPAWA